MFQGALKHHKIGYRINLTTEKEIKKQFPLRIQTFGLSTLASVETAPNDTLIYRKLILTVINTDDGNHTQHQHNHFLRVNLSILKITESTNTRKILICSIIITTVGASFTKLNVSKT